MAFVNANGISISYECSDLIEELKQDIAEFGKDEIVSVWCKDHDGVILYTNYDFIHPEDPIKPEEINEDEFLKEMSLDELLTVMEKQNKVTI